MSQKYVEELRNFVNRGLAYEFSDGGKSHVVGEQVASRIPLVGHSFKLDNPEYLAILTGPELRKPDISLVGEVKKDDDEQQNGAGEDE